MVWLMLGLLLVCALCSWARPDGALARSAARAFDCAVATLSQGDEEEHEEDDARRVAARAFSARGSAEQGSASRVPRAGQSRAASAPPKTAPIRKRVTPLMQKRVAVRYNFRCALCNLPLDETWETDHHIPLSQAKNAAEAERLNSIENLQPVHRACHQLKSSREAAGR